jgi:hypothetical protein
MAYLVRSPNPRPHMPRANPLTQPDIDLHLARQRAQFQAQLFNREGDGHQQVGFDLEGLIA